MSPEIRERLAEYAHDAWSGWMRYLFEQSILNADGTVTIPAWAADRWRRQAGTRYQDLSADEQQSDRKEAARMQTIMSADSPPLTRLAEELTQQEIAQLKMDVAALQKALGMLLSWMPQSAVSPIRFDEAARLINVMNGHK